MALLLTFGGNTLTLPSPEFDDSLEKKYRRIVRESRGKELIAFPKSGFGYLKSYDTYNYQFKALSEPLKQQLITFLDSCVGHLVIVRDYNNLVYQGIILTPSVDIINSSRGSSEVNLEIESISIVSIPPPPLIGV
jgi:hypothetical protein